MTPTICRECCRALTEIIDRRCPHCGSPRLIEHPELDRLSLAHIDCDAFYAHVEKRDDPSLADRPVIVGGRHRGVVTACCYVARLYGVHSAMPMFKAIKACPEAVVIKPDMAKYQRVGRIIRDMMRGVTPLVEPLSIDEAFLDLTGTERLHRSPPALTLARLAKKVEHEVGITVSIGLSYNKFLAKIASDLDKPRGFAVIGAAEAIEFLHDKPVSLIWGVGKSLHAKLSRDGLTHIGRLRGFSKEDLVAKYGAIGKRLHAFAHGRDLRRVNPDSPTKTVSAETTFNTDIADNAELRRILWRLSEKVSWRLKTAGLSAGGVTLKLKTKDFRTRTRSRRLSNPTEVAELLFRAAAPLLDGECDGTYFRLIGIGAHDLRGSSNGAASQADLLPQDNDQRLRRVEEVIDDVRGRLGLDVIGKGRGLRPPAQRKKTATRSNTAKPSKSS